LENFQLKVVSFFCSTFFLFRFGFGFHKNQGPRVSRGRGRERRRAGRQGNSIFVAE
jgi:hypothetical protein